MKKIGILTHYHDTTNYGGALQAYALCRSIHSLGYQSEQIDITWQNEHQDLDGVRSSRKKHSALGFGCIILKIGE